MSMQDRQEFARFVAEQMNRAGLGAITARRMFGGHGLYCDGLFVAIITGEQLYFKADAQTQSAFENRGLRRFTYSTRGKTVQLMYYEVPAEVFDEAHAMQSWGRLAMEAAVRARKPGRGTSRKTAPR